MRAWFKFFGRDFRDGVRGVLSLEEAGAYTILLSLIYETENRLLDDERIICAHLNVDPRVWKRIRRRLIEVGKLVVEDGLLTNLRATSELSMAQHVTEVRRTSGRSGGEQSGQVRAKSRKTNKPPEPNASDLPLYARAFQNTEADTEIASLRSAIPAQPGKARRRSSVPADLSMTDGARSFAAGRGFLNGNAEALWERFTAHHAAKGTQFANIEAGWRTWVLNEIKFNGERNVESASFAGRGERPRSAVEAILSDVGRKPG